MAEQLEAKLANGEAIDISQHALLISSMVRCARHLPVARVAKQLPTLAEHFAKIQQQSAEEVCWRESEESST